MSFRSLNFGNYNSQTFDGLNQDPVFGSHQLKPVINGQFKFLNAHECSPMVIITVFRAFQEFFKNLINQIL